MSRRTTLDLQGRSLWQLLASYGIGSWITLQVAETLSSLIGLPLWFGRALLVALLLGLVVLVATGLVQRRGSAVEGGPGLKGILTWKNWVRGGVAAGALVVMGTVGYLGLRATGVGPLGTLQAKGVFDAQERVILADFSGEVEPDGLTETVTTLLRIDLAQSPAFTVLEPVQLDPVLSRMQRDRSEPLSLAVAREAARREGIKAVVAGDVLQTGSSYVVSARIVAAATGEALVAVRQTIRDLSEIPDGVDRLSAQLRERIGESLRTIQGDPPLDQVTTSSMAALEKYVQADRANNREDTDRAVVLLQEALRADSTFAMAYRKLGMLYRNDGDSERARPAFTRAYELRQRLSDRERWLAEAAYLEYVEDDPQASMDRYVTLLEAYPTDRIALNNLGLAYARLGRTEDAVELYLRSVRLAGAPAATYVGAINALVRLDRVEEAEATLRAFEAAFPDNGRVIELRMIVASLRLDYAEVETEAERLVDRLRGDFPEEFGARISLAQARVVRGRVDEGVSMFVDAFAKLAEVPGAMDASPRAVDAIVRGLVALHYREDPTEVVRAVDRARGERGEAVLQFAALYGLAGRPDLGRALLDAYAAETRDEDYRESDGWVHATATLALAEGRGDEALELFHRNRANAEEPCNQCDQFLGETFAALAQPDSAIHYLESYLTTPRPNRIGLDFVGFWSVVPLLAELHAEHGDVARARELLTIFLEVTEPADAAYAPKRDRMRALLDGLR